MTTTATLAPDLAAALAAYIAKLEFLPQSGFRSVITTTVGSKNIKLVCQDGGSRRVHSFVDRETGDVFKPAGWSGPAKGARYNLLDAASLARLLDRVDIYGSYLYR